MALSKKQREILRKNVALLCAIRWVFATSDQYQQLVDALDGVCGDLREVLDEDGGAEE